MNRHGEPDHLQERPIGELVDWLRAENARLREALTAIRDIKPRPSPPLTQEWGDAIEACPECQRYKDHPIQQGICNEHRQPLWDRERHDADEIRVLGYRAKRIAYDALGAAS